MGILDYLRGGNVAKYPEIGLDEALDKYDLVDVDEDLGVVYLAEKPDLEPGAAVSQGEITGSGETAWRRARLLDYNPQLRGRRAIDIYREMRHDSVVRSSLRIAKTPILSARWFMEPASNDQADIEKANFVWKNLNEYMSMSWPQFLVECLYMIDYGVYVFEKVFEIKEIDGEQRVIWRKFAPRHPYEIEEFVYDPEGGPDAITIDTDSGPKDLEIAKALIFTYDKEAGDLWGLSALRSAYKHWFFKEKLYQIDAIQKERHGIGIPIIKLPPNFTPPDKVRAEGIGRNLRTNERAHVVLPPGWDVMFLKLEGQRVDALESAQHHADKLYENVLANFMVVEGTGSGAYADVQEHIFNRAVRFTAEIICDVLNKYAIQQLINFNWPEEELENGYPQLRVRRLGDERDWRVLSFAARNLVGAGIIRPDDDLEAWFRDELDMPAADIATMRKIVPDAPEEDDPDNKVTDDEDIPEALQRNPNRNAGSRQSRADNMRSAQRPGTTKGDGSGG
jgi:hypothetical protein